MIGLATAFDVPGVAGRVPLTVGSGHDAAVRVLDGIAPADAIVGECGEGAGVVAVKVATAGRGALVRLDLRLPADAESGGTRLAVVRSQGRVRAAALMSTRTGTPAPPVDAVSTVEFVLDPVELPDEGLLVVELTGAAGVRLERIAVDLPDAVDEATPEGVAGFEAAGLVSTGGLRRGGATGLLDAGVLVLVPARLAAHTPTGMVRLRLKAERVLAPDRAQRSRGKEASTVEASSLVDGVPLTAIPVETGRASMEVVVPAAESGPVLLRVSAPPLPTPRGYAAAWRLVALAY